MPTFQLPRGTGGGPYSIFPLGQITGIPVEFLIHGGIVYLPLKYLDVFECCTRVTFWSHQAPGPDRKVQNHICSLDSEVCKPDETPRPRQYFRPVTLSDLRTNITNAVLAWQSIRQQHLDTNIPQHHSPLQSPKLPPDPATNYASANNRPIFHRLSTKVNKKNKMTTSKTSRTTSGEQKRQG